MARTSIELLESVRSWHRDLEAAAPSWDDVEIVVRLSATDERVARQLLLTDRDALVARLPELRSLLAGELDADGGPVVESESDADPVSENEPIGPRLAPVEAERLRALSGWLADALAGGREVKAVTESQLVSIAEAAQPERAIKMIPQLRGFRQELEKVLEHANEGFRGNERRSRSPESSTLTDAEHASHLHREPEGAVSSTGHAESASGPTRPQATQRRSGLAEVTGFADYKWEQSPASPPEPANITFSATGSGSLKLTWPDPPADGKLRIFRVVTNDAYPPPSPELGDLVVATFDCEATDSNDGSTPVRHVTVWVNEGATEDQARAAQPSLYASDVLVLPVRDLVVRDDEGTVLGQWRAIEGLTRVDVFRIPIDIARANPRRYDVGTKLDVAWVSQGGFKDPAATPGAEYEYRIYAVAEVGGTDEMAPYVARSVWLETIVQPVSDLSVTARTDSDNTYDLTFTMPPQGSVEIYRRDTQPPSGIGAQVITRDALNRVGFTDDRRLGHGIDVVESRGWMRDVPWPKGWSRAYFTPVTVLSDNQIRVGNHAILTRSSAVSHVRLVERVDEQFLTFAWPEGVAIVKVYQGPIGATQVDPENELPIYELSHEDYERYGGAHLRNPLPAAGCAVHVVATSYTKGEARHSEPVTVPYRGLVRVHYDLQPVQAPGRRNRNRDAALESTLRRVLVRSSIAGTDVRVAVVHNTHRLPLHQQDGQQLESRVMNLVANADMVFHEQLDLAGCRGFVRLFVDVPGGMSQALAVLDPPVARLRCP